MDVRQLIYFSEIAEQKSFTKAAQKLNLCQPAISKSIRNLENELGVALFIRDGNKIALTDEGQFVLDHASDLISHFNGVEYTLHNMRNNNDQELSFGCDPLVNFLCDVDTITEFQASSGIFLSYEENKPAELIQKVFTMELDFAFCLLYDQPYKYLNKLKVEPIYEGIFIGLTKDTSETDFDYQKNHNLVMPYNLLNYVKEFYGFTKINGSVICTDNFDEIQKLVLHKGFIAIVPDILVSYFNHDLCRLNLSQTHHYSLSFISNKTVKYSKTVRQLKENIIKNIA